MLESLGGASVDFEPDQCFMKRAAVHERPLRARRRFEIHQPALNREQLSQAFGIAARDRQHADTHRRLFGRSAAATKSRQLCRPRRRPIIGCAVLLLQSLGVVPMVGPFPTGISPSGTSSVPSRTALVRPSGTASNRWR